MKKYKNSIVAVGFYILSIVIYFYLLYIPNIQPKHVFIPTLISLAIGIYFALVSKHKKENPKLGGILVVLGFLIIFSPFILALIGAQL